MALWRHAISHKEKQVTDDNQRYAPYLAWRTLFNLVLQLQNDFPARIDRSFLTGRSGADQTYLLKTLKAFGLMADDGKVLQPLVDLVQDDARRPALVAQLLRDNYPEVFALPPNATQQQLDELFREVYGLNGATLRKAETFFLHAAAFAELKLSTHFKTPRGVTASGGPRRRRARPARNSSGSSEGTGSTPPDPTPPSRRETSIDEEMRYRYFEALLKKVEATDADVNPDLLDRIESLFDRGGRRPAKGQRPATQPMAETRSEGGTVSAPDKSSAGSAAQAETASSVVREDVGQEQS
jgi:hypothetical protein